MDGAVARAFRWLLAFATIGCGPTIEEPIARLATCGEDGPVRVLEHGPDWGSRSQSFGDELIVHVYPNDFEASDAPPTQAWVVGSCGEQPRQVATDLEVHSRYDTLVACDGLTKLTTVHDIVRVDPNGGAEPVTLFEGVDCSLRATEHGWLSARYELHELWLQRDPLGTQPAERIATDFASYSGGCPILTSACDTERVLLGREVHYIDLEHQLVALDLVSGERRVMRDNADWVWLGPDGSLWWKERGTQEDGASAAAVHVLELSTGEDQILYRGTRPSPERPIAVATREGEASASLVDFEQRSVHPLPPGSWNALSRPGVDGLLVRDGDQAFIWSREQQRAVSLGPSEGGDICSREWWTDGLDVVRQPSCDGADGEVWSTPYDGSEARLVATGVSGPWQHFDSRVVWSTRKRRVAEYRYVGDLFVATEPDDRLRLDENAAFNAWPFKHLEGDVLYTVSDGERSGLWRSATE